MASIDETFLKLNLKLSGTLQSKFKIRYFHSENRIPSTTPCYTTVCVHTDVSTYIYVYIYIYLYLYLHTCMF